MKKSYKFLSIILSVFLLLSIMPTSVMAEEECSHTNAVYSDEFGNVEATCFEPGVSGYYYCEDCGCYLDENKENEYWEPLEAAKKPAIGHYFNTDTGTCDECGIPNAVYTKVTSLADINEEDMYIVVAEVDGKESTMYFVLGGLDERHPDEQGNVWCPTGVNNAIRVTANSNGSISLVNQEILEDGSPSEFMLDINPEQFGDLSELGLTTIMLKLPNHCIYPFQSYSYDNSGYMGVSRYISEYGMWDASSWVIDFYTTVVTDDTYRYEDEFGSKTHAEQVADGNIGENITEGNLLLYNSSFYPVGGAMFTLRLREYNDQYYFICGEDWALEGAGEWDSVSGKTPTNDTQYAISLYRYDVPTVDTHICEFGDWVADTDKDTHTHTCKNAECGKTETKSHNWNNGTETQAPTCTKDGIKTFTCNDCNATKTESIDALMHDWSKWIDDGANAATDTHTHTCQRENCGEKEQLSHDWGKWTPDSDNNHKKTCSICSGTRTHTHKWNDGEITQQPSHTEEGVRTFTCSECSAIKTEVVDKTTDHKFGDWTDNGDGTHSRSCACNKIETKEHKFGDAKVINWPTHLAPGEQHFTCADCDFVKSVDMPKTEEHEFNDWTDNKDGTHVRKCLCGESEIKAHNFDDGKITKEATHLEKGIKTFTCSDCDAAKEEEVEKTPDHKFGDWNIDETTKNKHYRECACGENETSDCNYSEGKVVVGPSDFGDGDVIIYYCNDCDRQMIVEHTATDNITHEEEKVSVSVPEGSTAVIDSTTILQVEKTDEAVSDTAQENIEQEIGDTAEALATYDISMLLNGAEIQPGGEVQVNIPLPQNINADDYTDITVVYIDDNGNVTPCETTVNDDGTVTFVTDHFSCYSIVAVPKVVDEPTVQPTPDTNKPSTEQQSPQTADNTVISLAALMFVSGFSTFVFCKKRTSKR